jgi:colanic acid/amylovoran biosynthesis glycosyltransferase
MLALDARLVYDAHMRVAALMETFPAWSETYILWHISELVRAGEDVSIFPSTRGQASVVQPEVSELRLLERVIAPEHSAVERRAVLRALGRSLRRHPLSTLRLAREVATARDARGWTQSLSHLALPGRVPARFDVLHAYFGPAGRRAASLRAIGALKGALVTSFLGFDANVLGARLGGRYYADLFERAEVIGVSSEFMRRKLLALGAPEARLIKLPLGLPLSRFEFRSKPYAGGPLRLISVGRLAEVKGFAWGLRGIALAVARGYDVKLDIVGDGPLKQELLAETAALRLGDHVTFHGALPAEATRRLVHDADVALYSGVRARDGAEEALGGAVLEAQAMGLPVIASDVGGVCEGLLPDSSGIVVPPESPEAIAAAIEQLLARAAEWPEMARRGRQHIEESFDSARLHGRWLALYRQISAKTE